MLEHEWTHTRTATETANWRMDPKGTAVPSGCHGHLSRKNEGKTHGIRRDQLPQTPLYTPRRIPATRKKGGMS